ncbi:methanol O-anthraniloyltransferase-like [Neltuma alba]|uniref:methanol O-anthraniloyltransferase-like n=1 Tax=Neltuma alba TaxID=207710 RepID=UPI0010A382B3|nr:methanol O-anthraniloyltransferase-like [Prosopis alba]
MKDMEVRKFGSEFCTKHSEAELVAPAKPTPCETKKLSDIDDQEGLRFHLPLVMFFRNDNEASILEGKDPAMVIREAISQALVYYYPLAGRLREGENRKLMVECNGEGVLFLEADADVSLLELGDSILPPCPYLNHFLLPLPASEAILGCPLLFFQVTRLSCGGFVLGVWMNHTVCDTLGLVQFLKMVSEFATHSPLSQIPVWQRHLLSARHPPRITCLHHEYHQPISHPNSQTLHSDPDSETVHESFFFGPKHIASLRNRLPHHLRNCSTFELLTACLWKCRTEALDLKPSEIVSISPFITARGKRGLDLPDGYYGNAFAFPTAISEAGLICNNPLGHALGLIRGVKAQMNKEYLSSVADLMVLKGRPKYRTNGNYLVADSSRVEFHKVDFGWGKPVYGGPAGAIPCVSFYAAFRNMKGENGIVVPILLPRKAMRRFLSAVEKMTSENAVDESYDHGMAMKTISKL